MKKTLILYSFLGSLLFCEDSKIQADFIDDLEYGKQLYENPRGISCKKCHQDGGKGGVIATYKHKGGIKELKAPEINQLSFEQFLEGVHKSKGVMPKYSLTQKELLAIYNYLIQTK